MTNSIKFENACAEAKKLVKDMTENGSLEFYLFRLQGALKDQFPGQFYDRDKTQWYQETRATSYEEAIKFFNDELNITSGDLSPPSDPDE